jgi:hypothetical protein
MAKQYIPGISGLLTEPNPADSPSNSLSEAENVVIDQSGKVQARHGINVNGTDKYAISTTNTFLPSVSNLRGGASISNLGFNTVIIDSSNNKFSYALSGTWYQVTLTSGTRTALEIKSQLVGSTLINNQIVLSDGFYVEIGAGSANAILGFTQGSYSYGREIRDTVTNNVVYSSITNNSELFFKFLQYKDGGNNPVNGYIVKQPRNKYVLVKPSDTTSNSLTGSLYDTNTTDSSYRIYQIDSQSAKTINVNEISYSNISNVLTTDKSLYLQTNKGLVESNLQDLFIPTYERYFRIRWPNLPALSYTLSRSSLYANWFSSGYKCGIRYTYFRELGYSDNDSSVIYESEPSRVYEIFNNGADSVIDIELNFNTIFQGNTVYEELNDFCQSNNGRKFGIRIYRTEIIPISKVVDGIPRATVLSDEYFLCTEAIDFDGLLASTTLVTDLTISNTVSVYRKYNTSGELFLNDTYTVVPNNVSQQNVPVPGGYLYSQKDIEYVQPSAQSIHLDNVIPAKVKVTGKTWNNSYYASTGVNDRNPETQTLDDDVYAFGTTAVNNYFAYEYKNVENVSKFFNTYQTIVSKSWADVAFTSGNFSNAEIIVEIWDYTTLPDAAATINKNRKLASGSIKLANVGTNFSTYPASSVGTYTTEYSRWPIVTGYTPNIDPTFGADNQWLLTFELNQLFEAKPQNKYLIQLNVKSFPVSKALKIRKGLIPINQYSYNTSSYAWTDSGVPTLTTISDTPYPVILSQRYPIYTYSYTTLNAMQDSVLPPYKLDVNTPFVADKYDLNFVSVLKSSGNGVNVTRNELPIAIPKQALWVQGATTLTDALNAITDLTNNSYKVCFGVNWGTSVNATRVTYDCDGVIRVSDTSVNTSSGETATVYAGQWQGVTANATTNTFTTITYSADVDGYLSNVTTSPNHNLIDGTIIFFSVGKADYTNPYINPGSPGSSPSTRTSNSALMTPSFPSPITVGTQYYVINAIGNTFQISTALNGSALDITTVGAGNIRFTRVDPQGSRYLVRNFTKNLVTNDDGIIDIGERLYIDKNLDGAENTNLIAPNSKLLTQFKDSAIYAGIKTPLNASFSVTSLPKSQQVKLAPRVVADGTIAPGSLVNLSLTNYSLLTSITIGDTGNLYLEAPFFNYKSMNISSFTNGTTYTTLLTSGTVTVSSANSTNSRVIKFDNFAGGSTVTGETLLSFPINATVFQRPKLKLRLTSNTNEITEIEIRLKSLFNRNGYYSLYNRYGVLDDGYLQANASVKELNVINSATGLIKRQNFIPRMVPGTADGQINPDGQHTYTSNLSITNNTNNIYYNATTNTLVLTGLNEFNLSAFPSPGMMLIQGFSSSNASEFYAIFNYKSHTVDTAVTNKITFNSVTLTYLSKNDGGGSGGGYVVPTTTLSTEIANFSANRYYLYFLPGTTEKNLPIYTYSPVTPDPTQPYSLITYSTTLANIIVTERHETLSSNVLPIFTFKPHINRDSTVVATFDPNGNYLFKGTAAVDTGAYLDQYAELIVDKFNEELTSRNISARLRKGSGVGEVLVSFDDGYSIELLNSTGEHQFLPKLDPNTYKTLAVKDDVAQYFKNELQFSRRQIPEVVTASSYNKLGLPDKEYIAFALVVDDLYAFKEDGIFRITDVGGSSIPVYQTSQITATVICQAAGSVQEINGEVIFIAQQGFMSIRDGELQNINGAIQRDISILLQTSPNYRIKSFVNKSKNLYYCTLINEVDSTLDVKSGTYIFNVKTRQWSFMNEEIIDGLEDFEKRNLVAYKQKSIVTTPYLSSFGDYRVYETLGTYNYLDPRTNTSKTISAVKYNFPYPLQTVTSKNAFYSIARERHTNNIISNAADQYDYISDIVSLVNTTNSITRGSPQFALSLELNSQTWYQNYWQIKHQTLERPCYSAEYINQNKAAIHDSVIQYFHNRKAYIRIYSDVNNFATSEAFEIKLISVSNYVTPLQKTYYVFEFINGIPTNWATRTVVGIRLEVGVPVKITFNPESANQPDTNKLFQEYMVHTETNNKAMAMNFKTDSRSAFLATDRKFEYDATASNRNVFRTYIPTAMARGRYLIRQVKHDLPLENLIITGQTIVMRDGSTRVQKDKDNS